MRLFVVIGGWDYEGYGQPDGIYSTLEAAERAKSEAYRGYDSIEIIEYELDVGDLEKAGK